MLGGMDSIDWSSLTHAYGNASDVPGQLRALAANAGSAQDEAIAALFGNVWHQGSVYEASAHVVPFLVELAATTSVEKRAVILVLIANIATGSSFRAAHESLDSWAKRRGTPEHEAQKARELEWVRAARDAVQQHADTLISLAASDSDVDVRACAAHVLAALVAKEPERITPTVLALLKQEQASVVRATLSRALGCGDASLAIPALEDLLAESTQAVAFYAALARTQLPAPSRACVRALCNALVHATEIDTELRSVSYDPRSAFTEANEGLIRAGAVAVNELTRLLEIFGASDRFESIELAECLLELASLSEHANARHQVIEALAHTDAFWESASAKVIRTNLLKRFRLPVDRAALRILNN